MLKFLWFISAPKDTIKKNISRNVWMILTTIDTPYPTTCHMSQSGGAYQWRVCFQWGLPRLVSSASVT